MLVIHGQQSVPFLQVSKIPDNFSTHFNNESEIDVGLKNVSHE
jgi:hypothetical protein